MMVEQKRHLFARFYKHPEVAKANDEACRRMEAVFLDLMERPEGLGGRSLARLPGEPLARVVADYVAGMTDRYVRDLSARLS